MRRDVVTVRIDRRLKPLLDREARKTGASRSAIIRDALRRHLLRLQFDRLRADVVKSAEAQGYLTDEDVFRAIS